MQLNTIKLIMLVVLFGYGCNKNYVPKNSNVPVITVNSNNSKPVAKKMPPVINKTASPPKVKRIVPPVVPAEIPQVIWVNDNAAKKNFDGRLYYDLEGRRYWKNYVDGKYYLYSRSMYKNKAFKPG